jgi:hypothetical protein
LKQHARKSLVKAFGEAQDREEFQGLEINLLNTVRYFQTYRKEPKYSSKYKEKIIDMLAAAEVEAAEVEAAEVEAAKVEAAEVETAEAEN